MSMALKDTLRELVQLSGDAWDGIDPVAWQRCMRADEPCTTCDCGYVAKHGENIDGDTDVTSVSVIE